MHEYLQEPSKLKNHLIHRLDLLLGEMYMLIASPIEQQHIRGNCNEIEILLIEFFGMTGEQIDLIEEKARKEREYFSKKHGGYCLTGDGKGNHWWLKDHERVDTEKLNFCLTDNGVGDERARQAEANFRQWISESGIDEAEWLQEADVTLPRLSEDWDDNNDEFD